MPPPLPSRWTTRSGTFFLLLFSCPPSPPPPHRLVQSKVQFLLRAEKRSSAREQSRVHYGISPVRSPATRQCPCRTEGAAEDEIQLPLLPREFHIAGAVLAAHGGAGEAEPHRCMQPSLPLSPSSFICPVEPTQGVKARDSADRRGSSVRRPSAAVARQACSPLFSPSYRMISVADHDALFLPQMKVKPARVPLLPLLL